MRKMGTYGVRIHEVLARYEIESVAVVSERLQFGCNVKIFADGDRYLEFSSM